MHIKYAHKLPVSTIVKSLKGRTSILLQKEFPELQKKYFGKQFRAIGYGTWSTGNITDDKIDEYLEYHKQPSNGENSNLNFRVSIFNPSYNICISNTEWSIFLFFYQFLEIL